jgi:hypothetical protein
MPRRGVYAAVALVAGAAVAAASEAFPLAFTYPYTYCRINRADSFGIGETMHLCLNLNGKVTSIFNVVTDQFSAISLAACESCNLRGEVP